MHACMHSGAEEGESNSVQIFAQLDPTSGLRSMKNEWAATVERATKRLKNGKYRVTVTDPWGGVCMYVCVCAHVCTSTG